MKRSMGKMGLLFLAALLCGLISLPVQASSKYSVSKWKLVDGKIKSTTIGDRFIGKWKDGEWVSLTTGRWLDPPYALDNHYIETKSNGKRVFSWKELK